MSLLGVLCKPYDVFQVFTLGRHQAPNSVLTVGYILKFLLPVDFHLNNLEFHPCTFSLGVSQTMREVYNYIFGLNLLWLSSFRESVSHKICDQSGNSKLSPLLFRQYDTNSVSPSHFMLSGPRSTLWEKLDIKLILRV